MSAGLHGTDFAIAIAIAILIIAFALCVWPGYARTMAADVEGTWASQTGKLFQIHGRPSISPRAIVVLGGGGVVRGELRYLRSIYLDNGEKGHVGLDGNIVWRPTASAGRDVWYPQGVKPRRQ